MLNNKTIMVVMPAYNAAKTLAETYHALPRDIIDHVLLVDDGSSDDTAAVARQLGIKLIQHVQNRGYGANQKTCYRVALEIEADIVVMLHPDYQYDPRLLGAMAAMISSGVYDIALGSRIIGGDAMRSGMPWWKYIANRMLTMLQNFILGSKLSEFHTGYRAYSKDFLSKIRIEDNSDDFVFDNQILVQAILNGFSIGEISVPTKYFEEASSINFQRSCKYGLGVLLVTFRSALHRLGIYRYKLIELDSKYSPPST